MRIAIATFHRNLIGGVEKYLQVLLPALIGQGHEVALLHELPLEPGLERIDPPGGLPVAWCVRDLGLAEIKRLLSGWKPDVVFDQGLEHPSLEDALLELFPTVLFAHNYYGTCGTGSKCHSFPRIQPCERRFGPACAVLHYPRHCGALDPREAWQTFQRQSRRRSSLPRFRFVLVASSHMRDEYLRHGLSADRVHLVPLPGDGEPTESAEPRPQSSPERVLMISRLTPVKGGHFLIPAISHAARILQRPLKLTIAGDGPERPRLEGLAKKSDAAVEFTGWVDGQRRQELLRQTDLLAVPSLWPEPFGLVGLEAGHLGIPAVGYRVGGIPDWLIGGQTGELAPGDPPSVEGLTDAVARALGDQSHYRSLCCEAWRRSRQFTLQAHLEKLQAMLGQAQKGFAPSSLSPVAASSYSS